MHGPIGCAGRWSVLSAWFALVCSALAAAASAEAPTRVSENHRYLLKQDGSPFFYLGDTAWELFHRLDRDEAVDYLRNRAEKRFTVIQAVVLAELGGLDRPNANGDLPLVDKDPSKPVEAYFRHVDFIVNEADRLGLVVGMLPTWGSWWHDPKTTIFTPENAKTFGEFLGKRYKDKPIIWILGGDRNIENDRQKSVIRALADGLKAGDGGRHLMTFHPRGGQTSSLWFQADDWLAFNMLQSGHARDRDNYRRIAADYAKSPTKPCMDGEPGYEDHPGNFNPKNGYLDQADVRKFAYWALFAGAHGHTYGCHDVWQFFAPGRNPITAARTPWREALDLPGAGQMRHVRALLESRPFLNRVPGDSLLIVTPAEPSDHVQATRAEDGSYALIYSATGQPFAIRLDKLSGDRINASWFDPRLGVSTPIDSFDRSGVKHFQPPTQGRGQDWVLVLDDAARGFPPPGTSAP